MNTGHQTLTETCRQTINQNQKYIVKKNIFCTKLHNFLSESQQSQPTCVVYQHETLIINVFMNLEWNMFTVIFLISSKWKSEIGLFFTFISYKMFWNMFSQWKVNLWVEVIWFSYSLRKKEILNICWFYCLSCEGLQILIVNWISFSFDLKKKKQEFWQLNFGLLMGFFTVYWPNDQFHDKTINKSAR